MRNLVTEFLDFIDQRFEVSHTQFGSFVQNDTDLFNNGASSSFINAGHDGSWVGELVFFEKSVQSELEDFFVSLSWKREIFLELGNSSSQKFAGHHVKNFMSIGSSIIASLVILACTP